MTMTAGGSSVRVLQGTCGWSDFSLGSAWNSNKSAEQRLAMYARHFPCVEVDTSSYAIPQATHTAKWLETARAVYAGFKFHFKAFGLFCHRSAPIASLPWQAKKVLQDAGIIPSSSSTTTSPSRNSAKPQHIALSAMPPGCEQACWDAYHAALEPVVKAGAMACCVFQFQLNFQPSPESRAYVERCRRMLRPDVIMAVEFRNRAWFQEPAAMSDLVAWCTAKQLCLIAADELRHETFQKDRAQYGLPPGQTRELMAMSLAATRPDVLVVRLHRRHGTLDRLLAPEEHKAWAERLVSVAPSLTGQIYFLWGTDWEDAPLINARALNRALPVSLQYDHEGEVARRVASRPGTITSMFARAGASSGGSSWNPPLGNGSNDVASDAYAAGVGIGADQGLERATARSGVTFKHHEQAGAEDRSLQASGQEQASTNSAGVKAEPLTLAAASKSFNMRTELLGKRHTPDGYVLYEPLSKHGPDADRDVPDDMESDDLASAPNASSLGVTTNATKYMDSSAGSSKGIHANAGLGTVVQSQGKKAPGKTNQQPGRDKALGRDIRSFFKAAG